MYFLYIKGNRNIAPGTTNNYYFSRLKFFTNYLK